MTQRAPHRVLVVDDDRAALLLYRSTLELEGFDVVEASSGAEALSAARRGGIDMVLLDSHMPGMGGLEVVVALRALPETHLLPVVMVTAADELTERVRGLEAGADDYLVKPVAAAELVARVRSRLRSHARWSRSIERSLRERLRVAEALGALASDASATSMAAAACEELRTLQGVVEAAIFAFRSPEASLRLAACTGAGGASAPPLAMGAEATRWLRARAALGPAIGAETGAPGHLPCQRHEAPPFAPPRTHLGERSASGEPGHVAVTAPLGARSRPTGLLSIAWLPDPLGSYESLATTADLSALLSSLLGPRIEEAAAAEGSLCQLRSHLSPGAFATAFQPVVDLTSGEIVGVEALTRFADGASPDRRLADARAAGIGVLAEETLAAAAVEAARAMPARLWLALNVSAVVLQDSEALERSVRLAGRPVVLEITEHEPVEDYDALRSGLRRFPEQTRLAVDDAGAGYASLSHVLRLRPDLVKLDRSWVQGVDGDPARRTLVSALVGFAAGIGSRLLAEGVETREELRTLERAGVTLAQGYLLGRPQALAEGPPAWTTCARAVRRGAGD